MDAWIEIKQIVSKKYTAKSHPLWMRGLKLLDSEIEKGCYMSHPLWMRGLKFATNADVVVLDPVASFMDAWIEIRHLPPMHLVHKSHPLWMRGLK